MPRNFQRRTSDPIHVHFRVTLLNVHRETVFVSFLGTIHPFRWFLFCLGILWGNSGTGKPITDSRGAPPDATQTCPAPKPHGPQCVHHVHSLKACEEAKRKRAGCAIFRPLRGRTFFFVAEFTQRISSFSVCSVDPWSERENCT